MPRTERGRVVYTRPRHDFLPSDLVRLQKTLAAKPVGFWTDSKPETLLACGILSVAVYLRAYFALVQLAMPNLVRDLLRTIWEAVTSLEIKLGLRDLLGINFGEK